MEMDKGVRDDNFTPTRHGLARPDQNHLAPHGHYSPRRGGGAGTGQDFCPDHRGGAVMGIGIDPPRPAPISPTSPDLHLLLIILQKY